MVCLAFCHSLLLFSSDLFSLPLCLIGPVLRLSLCAPSASVFPLAFSLQCVTIKLFAPVPECFLPVPPVSHCFMTLFSPLQLPVNCWCLVPPCEFLMFPIDFKSSVCNLTSICHSGLPVFRLHFGSSPFWLRADLNATVMGVNEQ